MKYLKTFGDSADEEVDVCWFGKPNNGMQPTIGLQKPSRGVDGSHVFTGEGHPSRVLIISPDGRMFIGETIKALEGVKNSFDVKVVHDALKEIK